MIMHYGEFANMEEIEQSPKLFTSTETLEQYVERGGKVTKLPAGKLLWGYQVRSTAKSKGATNNNIGTFNSATSDEV